MTIPSFGLRHDQAIERHRTLSFWQYHERIEVDAGQRIGVIGGEPGQGDECIGQGVHVGRRPTAYAVQKFGAVDAGDHSHRLIPAEGRKPKDDIVKHFDEHTAETEHHGRAEHRIDLNAECRFDAAADHRRHNHAVGMRIGGTNFHPAQQFVIKPACVVRCRDIEFDTADLRFMADIGAVDLHDDRAAEGRRGGGGLIGVFHNFAFDNRNSSALQHLAGLPFAQCMGGETLERPGDAGVPRPLKRLPAHALSEWESREVLESAGIPIVEGKIVKNADQAAAAAATFGRPVVMKINGADISHKTEIGGVELNVATADDARRLYDELLSRVKIRAPDAHPDGVIVAPMIGGGVETTLGVQVDPVFGPAVMFGLGGVFVEVLHDVVFRLAPFGRDEAMRMISGINGAKLLHGVRGRPPSDVDALADALVALSRFAADHADTLASVDLNPFVVLPEGQGAVALDCLVVPKTE